jgi:excisionase family DNA binding protein
MWAPVERVVAWPLAEALEEHARRCPVVHGLKLPPELAALALACRNQVRTVQDKSSRDNFGSDVVGPALMRLFATSDEAADVVGQISRSTVKRLVAAGELRAVKIGGRSLIHVDDLASFAGGRLARPHRPVPQHRLGQRHGDQRPPRRHVHGP